MTETHYLALYRKYRPQTFEDVCGRDAIIQTLRNQITSGRVGHSYLFSGTRGTGKTTIAKIFARAVNCEHPVDGSPCGECECCRATMRDANLNVVEMDAASNNGVDNVRDIIEQVAYSPTLGRYRVFIIDEVHMLSGAAFNALLKTLEEPPAYCIFILATTEPNKLPLTILSRCQRYDFGRVPVATIAERLKVICDREGLAAEDRALRYIASAADGSIRDGLSILDQCCAFNYGQETLTYDRTLEILGAVDVTVFSDLFRAMHECRAQAALTILDRLLSEGRELVQFTADYISYLRNIMLLKASEAVAASLDVSEDHLTRMLEDARSSDLQEILRQIRIFSELTEQIRYSGNRRILTEAAIIRLCEPSMDIARDPEEKWNTMQERIRILEDKIIALEQQAATGALVRHTAAGGGETSPGAVALTLQNPTSKTPSPNPAPEIDPLGAAAGADRVTPGSGSGSGDKQPSPRLPEALSDDLKDIAGKWDSMVGALPQERHYMKMVLRGVQPTATEDNALLLVFSNTVTYGFFADGVDAAEHREYLGRYLQQRTGRDVTIRYKLLDNGQRFSDNYVDLRGIRSRIHMDIETDTDDTGDEGASL